MSQNINKTTRHLKFCYISILTNLLRTRLNVSLFYLYTYCIYIYMYMPLFTEKFKYQFVTILLFV